jgi:hypothetical protein
MTDDLCECPICGRMHQPLHAGVPPATRDVLQRIDKFITAVPRRKSARSRNRLRLRANHVAVEESNLVRPIGNGSVKPYSPNGH